MISLAGRIAYSILSLVLTIRLFRLARRTREQPEFLLGLMFLFGGVLGNTLGFLRPGDLPTTLDTLWHDAYRLCLVAETAAVLFAAWRIFRPDKSWPGVVVGALITMLLSWALFLGHLDWNDRTHAAILLSHPAYWGSIVARVFANGWMAFESLRTQSMLRRRTRIRLPVDMELVARMRFWGLGTACKALLYAALATRNTVAVLTDSERIAGDPFQALFGIATTFCFWIAFFPPAFYRNRLERHAKQTPS